MSEILTTSNSGKILSVKWHDNENRFNDRSIFALQQVLQEVEDNEDITVLLVTGDTKFFSNGLDLDWMATIPEEAPEFLREVHRLFRRMTLLPALTIAAINGHAFAGGAMFAACHDFLFMREDRGFWCLPEIDLGLPLTPMMHAVVSAKLNRRTYHEAIMTGKRYSGPEAQISGIVHQTATEEFLLEQANTFAEELAMKHRSVIIEHKKLLYSHLENVPL